MLCEKLNNMLTINASSSSASTNGGPGTVLCSVVGGVQFRVAPDPPPSRPAPLTCRPHLHHPPPRAPRHRSAPGGRRRARPGRGDSRVGIMYARATESLDSASLFSLRMLPCLEFVPCATNRPPGHGPLHCSDVGVSYTRSIRVRLS